MIGNDENLHRQRLDRFYGPWCKFCIAWCKFLHHDDDDDANFCITSICAQSFLIFNFFFKHTYPQVASYGSGDKWIFAMQEWHQGHAIIQRITSSKQVSTKKQANKHKNKHAYNNKTPKNIAPYLKEKRKYVKQAKKHENNIRTVFFFFLFLTL